MVMEIPKGLYYGWFNLRTASLPLANPGGSIVALRHCRSRCSFRSLPLPSLLLPQAAAGIRNPLRQVPPPGPFPSIWLNHRTAHCVRIALFASLFRLALSATGGASTSEPLAEAGRRNLWRFKGKRSWYGRAASNARFYRCTRQWYGRLKKRRKWQYW